MKGWNLAIPRDPFVLVPKDAPAITRPALEHAHWRCESCGEGSDLRVAEGFGEKVVLCRGCRIDDGFQRVCGRRRAARTAARRPRSVTT